MDLCHSRCDQGCDIWPTASSMNCLICSTGFTHVPATNYCQINCALGQYPNADYSSCQNCPSCCTTCGYSPPALHPYFPQSQDLKCLGSVHQDFDFTAGACILKTFIVNIVTDSTREIITINFDKIPSAFDLATNVELSTSSGWLQGTDFTVQLELVTNPLIRVLKLKYLKTDFSSQIFTIKIKNVQHQKGIPQAVYTYGIKSISFKLIGNIPEPITEPTITKSPTNNIDDKDSQPFGLEKSTVK